MLKQAAAVEETGEGESVNDERVQERPAAERRRQRQDDVGDDSQCKSPKVDSVQSVSAGNILINQEPGLSSAAAVEEMEEEESVDGERVQEHPNAARRHQRQADVGDDFRCKRPKVNAAQSVSAGNIILNQEPGLSRAAAVEEAEEGESGDGERVQEHPTAARRRQRQADGEDSRSKRPKGNAVQFVASGTIELPPQHDCVRAAAAQEEQESHDLPVDDEEREESLHLPMDDDEKVQDSFHLPMGYSEREQEQSLHLPMDGDEREQEQSLHLPMDDDEREQERRTAARCQQQPSATPGDLENFIDPKPTPNVEGDSRESVLVGTLITEKDVGMTYTSSELDVMEALVQMKVDIDAGALTHQMLLKNLQAMKLCYAREFNLLDVAKVVCQFAQRLLRSWFVGWHEAMEKGNREPLVYRDTICSWKDLLLLDQKDKSLDAAICPYTELVSTVVVPVMRRYIINSYDMHCHSPDFFVDWAPLLPQLVLEDLLNQAVIPKLSAIIDSCNHTEIIVVKDRWEFVTLRKNRILLLECAEPRLDIIRQKLEENIRQMTVRNGLYALSNLSYYVDPAVSDDLTMRYVIPKLKRMLEFQVNVHDQDFDTFTWVQRCGWVMVPVHLMVQLLESKFFPKWFDALYDWLDSGEPDLNEVAMWYQIWKSKLGFWLLKHERIQQLLTGALHMMQQAAEGVAVDEPVFFNTYRPIPAPRNPIPVPYYERLSFKECIQEYAIGHDLLFMPLFGKYHDGLPVYVFGKVSIVLYTKKRLVHAQVRQGGATTWQAVPLRELVAMNN